MKFLLILFVLFSSIFLHAGSLREFYLRNKTIELSQFPAFGKTDWESLVLLETFPITSHEDGAIFLSNFRDNQIIKFNADGELLFRFGRTGQGPGDLESPTAISILDNQSLVVFNSDGDRRVSFFDLNGKFRDSRRFKNRPLSCLALKNNRLAIVSMKLSTAGKNRNLQNAELSLDIKNLDTDEEKQIESCRYQIHFINDGFVSFVPQSFKEQYVIQLTPRHDILFGLTTSNILKMYSPEGKLIQTYTLMIKPFPVNRKLIEEYKEATIKYLQENITDQEMSKRSAAVIRNTDFNIFFREHLPLYKNVFMDPEGNLLVFKWEERPGERYETFQVYTPDGALLCENRIQYGESCFHMENYRKNLVFSNKNLILMVERETDDGDKYAQLLRIPTGAASLPAIGAHKKK